MIKMVKNIAIYYYLKELNYKRYNCKNNDCLLRIPA